MAVKPMLFEIGASFRADRLLVQTTYLATLATREEASIAAHGWPVSRTSELLTRATELKEALAILGQDLILPELVSAHRRTEAAREWGCQAMLYLRNALEDPHPVLQHLQAPPTHSLLGDTLRWVTPLVELAHHYERELSTWGGGSEFAARGRHIRDQLREEASRGLFARPLSSSEERLLELKSDLYFSLCRLVRCGQALWIEDDLAARAYHLRYLDPRTPVPAELATVGTGISAGFQIEAISRRKQEAERLEADLKVETLAMAPVTPLGQQDVPLVARGWYNEPEVLKGGAQATSSLQGGREREARHLKGMSIGTDWGIHRDPAARPIERETPAHPAGQNRPDPSAGASPKDAEYDGLRRKGASSERWGEPGPARGTGRGSGRG